LQQRPLHCVLLNTSEDHKHADKLVIHLVPAVRAGDLTIHRYAPAHLQDGSSWLTQMLAETDRILLLATPRLFSDLLWDLLSEKLRNVPPQPRFKIVPIILEPCDWKLDPLLTHCQELPRNEMDFRSNKFFPEVARELKAMALAARQEQS